MFPYYGSKVRLGPLYPPPAYGRIIEPFAGAAAYSMQYPQAAVLLIDRDPVICAVWRYLIAADPRRILQLPVPATGDRLGDLTGVNDEERALIGFYRGRNRPDPGSPNATIAQRSDWHSLRRRVARDVERVRHWQVIEGDYREAPNDRATWFIDPPYQGSGGASYTHNNSGIDYAELAAWCRGRRGQVIVCEYGRADWLPFEVLTRNQSQQNVIQTELIWTQGGGSLPIEPTSRRARPDTGRAGDRAAHG